MLYEHHRSRLLAYYGHLCSCSHQDCNTRVVLNINCCSVKIELHIANQIDCQTGDYTDRNGHIASGRW